MTISVERNLVWTPDAFSERSLGTKASKIIRRSSLGKSDQVDAPDTDTG